MATEYRWQGFHGEAAKFHIVLTMCNASWTAGQRASRGHIRVSQGYDETSSLESHHRAVRGADAPGAGPDACRSGLPSCVLYGLVGKSLPCKLDASEYMPLTTPCQSLLPGPAGLLLLAERPPALPLLQDHVR